MDTVFSFLTNFFFIAIGLLFLGITIFVHELGHFLAAKKRGLRIERFSIGFGPKIVGWTDKDGVEWRLSWIPLGGYVALPDLTGASAIEGIEKQESEDTEDDRKISYSSRMIVLAAGATFNILFAVFLATILWFTGQEVPKSALTTEIGEVPERIENFRGEMVPAPAHEAGLRPGDEIVAVNDKPVGNWSEIVEFIILLTKRTEERKPVVNFTIARNGETKEISVEPILATNEKIRRVGIAPKGYPPLVAQVSQGMPAAEAGIRPGDKIVGINGREVSSYRDISNLPEDERGELVTLTVERTTEAGETVRKQFEMKPRMPEGASDFARDNQRPILGITMRLQTERVRLNPVEQTWERMETIYRTLYALVAGELRLRNMSGPVGIIDALQQSARSGIETLLWITLFININLAILNILPIPVLDGGHMLFATVTKIRGKPLPQNFIEATHAAFLILLLTAVVYITFFDIQRQIDRHTPVESPASATSTAEQPTGADEKTEGGRQDESASEQAPPNEGDASS